MAMSGDTGRSRGEEDRRICTVAGGTWRRLAFVMLLTLCCAIASAATGCSDLADDARALEDVGDWSGALVIYKEILAGDSDNLAAMSGAAVALMFMRRWDEALAYQELVVAADPEDAQTRVELGFNYLNHQHRPTDAVTVLAEAAALEPSGKYLSFLAQAQEEANDSAGAEKSLRKAIAVDETYVFAYRLLVGLLESQGRDSEAGELVDAARSLGLDVTHLN